jgi:hypothetical protein
MDVLMKKTGSKISKKFSCMLCQWYRMHHACGINDTAWIVHAVSMTPHAFLIYCIPSLFCIWFSLFLCMRCQWHCMHFKKFEYLREFEFIFEKALAPYQAPRTDVLMKKTEGRKSRDTVPLKCSEIFALYIFSSNNTPCRPDSRAKAFLNIASIQPRYYWFLNSKIVRYMWCQWPFTHYNILLVSPFKFTYFCRNGIGQFANILYMFVIDIHSH